MRSVRGLAALVVAGVACASFVEEDDPIPAPQRDAGGDADAASSAQDAGVDVAIDPDAGVDADKPDVAALGCGVPNNGLRAYWRFDEGSGNKVGDCSSFTIDGTLQGSSYRWISPGRIGGSAIEFDGGGSYVNLGNPSELGMTGALTIVAWVKITNFSGNGRIISKSSGGTPADRGWELNLEKPGGSPGFAVLQIPGGQADPEPVATGPLPTDQWLHLAGTYEPNQVMRIYVNGQLAGVRITNVPGQNSSAHDARIGNRDDGITPLRGAVDDLRLYTRALSPAEIAALAAQ